MADHDSGTLTPDPPALGALVHGLIGREGDRPDQPNIYLNGDVLGCECPECQGPMSIRFWLGVADCALCGCSIELTEEQEEEAQRLLAAQRGERPEPAAPPAPTPAPAAAPAPHPAPPVAATPPPPPQTAAPAPAPVAPSAPAPAPIVAQSVTRPTAPVAQIAPVAPTAPSAAGAIVAQPVHTPVAQPAAHQAAPRQPQPAPSPSVPQPQSAGTRRSIAAHQPIGVRKHLVELQEEGLVRVWIRTAFRDMPAWVASAVIHLLALILIAMWMLTPERPHQFTLVARIGDDPVGDPDQDVEMFEETEFDVFSEFPVDMLSPNEVVVEDDNPVDVEASPGAVEMKLDDAFLNVASSPDLVPGAIGMFDGRGEAARGKLIETYGGTEESEAAVARGLKWLAKVQNSDGSWSLDKYEGQRSNTGGTALGCLPFLGAGQTHRDGRYQSTVKKALDWIIKNQKPDGDLRGDGTHISHMYAHAQCAIVLCEAFALTRDDKLRHPSQKAIDFIVKSQHKAGGWRYSPGQPGDTSVLGWQLMALRSAQMAYLKVPRETFLKATDYLDTAQTNSSGSRYAYVPRQGTSPVMTAEALLCRQYTGWPARRPGLVDGVSWLLSDYPPDRRQTNIYYWYYATQLMHHQGGAVWKTWNDQMRDLLVDTQVTRGAHNGSWTPVGGHSRHGGRIYMTSLALLTLEVYYRHLPLYERPAGIGRDAVADASDADSPSPPEKPAAAPSKPAEAPKPPPTTGPSRPKKPEPFNPLDL